MLSSNIQAVVAFASSAYLCSALPWPNGSLNDVEILLQARALTFEYTAWGDSYASGVGAGAYIDGRRCLRYDDAYPQWIADDPDDVLPDGGSTAKFNNVVCSGSNSDDAKAYEFYTTDQEYGQPSFQFYPRPATGRPVLATLTIGGNNIDFPGILNNCIIGSFPAPLNLGFTDRTCDAQIELSWSLLAYANDHSTPNADTVAQVNSVIAQILAYVGNSGIPSDDFYLYVTGYGQFFNADDPGCNSVTFARNPNGPDQTPLLTQELRAELNALSVALNAVVTSAASGHTEANVHFVDIDGMLTGHRFCEAGIQEPDENNPNLWFFHYPYSQPEATANYDSIVSYLNSVQSNNVNTLTWDPQTTLYADYLAQFWSLVDEQDLLNAIGAPNEDSTAAYDFWSDFVGYYAKVFHPQSDYHHAIYRQMANQYSSDRDPPGTGSSPPGTSTGPTQPLETTGVGKGIAVKAGTELRILPIGDSITVGFEDPSGDGYRFELFNDLSADHVVFAGTEQNGFCNGYFAAWSGNTIDEIASKMGPSLEQRPNIVLIHAGTNDMAADSTGTDAQGNDPTQAAQRLGNLIDQVISTCPDASVLVAQIINTIQTAPESSAGQDDRIKMYNSLIPGIVASRQEAGSHILTVDFGDWPTSGLNSGGVHPSTEGYSLMGDWWYDYIHQIPTGWINAPVGSDPQRPACNTIDDSANGGPDPGIPLPDLGISPVSSQGTALVASVAADSSRVSDYSCTNAVPDFNPAGQIALGFGKDGNWLYEQNWVSVGQVAEGLHLDPDGVRLADMNGDGKADYLWLDADTGRLICWINNLPGLYAAAGSNGGIIADGAGPRDAVQIADLNGDGMADYLVVDQDTGAVTVYWNEGPDDNWENGWRFVPGGVIATGVPHANWATLRFPDINGDGRADYVIEGVDGSLGLWLNTGQPGSYDVLFIAMGGIASGASQDLTRIVFADFDGDGRDDYGIWDDQAGLTGFLNIRTDKEGVPFFADQGPPKSIAEGITQPYDNIILADMDGDGKDDYVYVDRTNGSGALFVWYNRGSADTSRAMDGLYFADMDGDGADDYIWVAEDTGAPTLFLNKGPSGSDSLGWSWSPVNGANPIAAGAGSRSTVQFADINCDGKKDYVTLDAKTGELYAYLNNGPADNEYGWAFEPIGSIASGLGPGKNTRFGDIDGDGCDDYIQLDETGGAVIYRNNWDLGDNRVGDPGWLPFPDDVNPSGIGQRPQDIQFRDIDGDGKVDYLYTRSTDGAVFAYRNNFPNQPTWTDIGQIWEFDSNADDIISGASTRWATLQATGRASYIQVNPQNGAIAAMMNDCEFGSSTRRPNIESNSCNPDVLEYGCSANITVPLHCYCGAGPCRWSPLGVCENGAKTCQISTSCGAFGSCC